MSNQHPMNNFEQSLTRLEEIVSTMEQGQLTLEQSLNAFEEGVSLTKKCQSTLKDAEQRVEILLKQDEDAPSQPFTEDNSSED